MWLMTRHLTSAGWQMSGRDTAFLSEALSTQPSGAICASAYRSGLCGHSPARSCPPAHEIPYVLCAVSPFRCGVFHVSSLPCIPQSISVQHPSVLRVSACSLDVCLVISLRSPRDLLESVSLDLLSNSLADVSARADLVESFVGARGARMEPLPYPPIHVHHVHLSPSIETLRYHGTGISSLPYKQQLAIERHGEWTRLGLPVCDRGSNQRSCHSHSASPGFMAHSSVLCGYVLHLEGGDGRRHGDRARARGIWTAHLLSSRDGCRDQRRTRGKLRPSHLVHGVCRTMDAGHCSTQATDGHQRDQYASAALWVSRPTASRHVHLHSLPSLPLSLGLQRNYQISLCPNLPLALSRTGSLQSTYEAYFFVEPYKPVISWYTATMGPHVQRQRVLYVKSHTHMNLLKKWLLFDSPPEALLGPSSFLTKFPASYPPSRTEVRTTAKLGMWLPF